jgi:hypothetical protein
MINAVAGKVESQWRAIHQASRILEKIDERWPMEERKALDNK